MRSAEGTLLAGDEPAKLVYHSTDTTPGYITAQPAGSTSPPAINITSGELKGLLELRDIELPKIYDQLGEFVSKAVDQLNAANNDAAAYPAPVTMAGRDTGLDLTTAVSGFTGKTTVAIVNPQGVLQRKRRHRLHRRDHVGERRGGHAVHACKLPGRPEHRPGRRGHGDLHERRPRR